MTTRFEDGPPGYRAMYRDGDPDGLRARVPVRHARERARDMAHDVAGYLPSGFPGHLRTRRLAAASVGATAIGALAVGAVAIGALAISRLAISRMGMREGHIQSLTIDELRVRRLRIDREEGPRPLPRYAAARRP
ncbi:hypothetical protein [Salinarimonas ramus]|uniref:Uncharacterized protein n=1 Tax=Salinarimonas ramus TaxID=690164 RepID=A0A917QHU8_9HYPH|nr:hypothetical protein [Salinarimonas ramus]GGK51981.1 hypothetical protein GCM10011322_43750 [Salinarimonas ramus]